ncbi:hypothetical protein NDU88_004279 [Pleurodeles waltl]|uniref:Helix-turn-helix domain-containing protein n=1 Tax=Pleurodeles waltl TaxID=8319 RepID=A0AAV7T772_PLEWA|nr:hypothetical protein NDU88_004279 [Pleurodeles waltl]
MGSTFAPSLACLYVDHFEKEMVLTEENPYVNHIRLWKRYIDDILIIWRGTKEEATTFITWLNTLNPFLRFTATLGDPAVSFLDLLITERNGSLTTEVYYKPTDCNTLLQFQSFHPRSLRENLPVGQFLRLRRNCTELTDYKKHAQQVTNKLRARGYPDHLLRRADKRARGPRVLDGDKHCYPSEKRKGSHALRFLLANFVINAGCKIYTRVLANRLGTVISELVNPNQHGFIPGQDTTSHVNTAITALEAASVGRGPNV